METPLTTSSLPDFTVQRIAVESAQLNTTWRLSDLPTSKQTLLFAHGFGQTQGAWLKTREQCAKHGFSSVAYDARGHGESDHNPADIRYSGEQFANDMIAVVGEIPQPPVLVAASMGGLFGLITEARWPGLFKALILVDITPRWETKGLQRILQFMSAFPEGFNSLEQVAEVIATYLPHRPQRKSQEELQNLLRQKSDGRWYWHWDRRLLEEFASDSEQHQSAIADAARQVQCPVLLISAGKSDLVSEQTVTEFQQLVPHATHTRIADATHMIAGDDNDAFSAVVIDYLNSL